MTEENNQMNLQGFNIVTILKRLEAATSRLEDVTIFQEQLRKDPLQSLPAHGSDKELFSSTTADVPSQANETVKEINSESDEKFVTEFQNIINEHVTPFVSISNDIDPLIGTAAGHFAKGFDEQLAILKVAAKAKEPAVSDPKYAELVNPINVEIQKISQVKESNRKFNYINHLNTISEGSPVLGWLVTKSPVSYIDDFKDSAQFWSNRILKEFKEKDASQVEWVKSFLEIFNKLKAYVNEYHKEGLSWNNNGKDLSDIDKIDSNTGNASSSAPPPPPPPPPSDLYEDSAKSKSTSQSETGGLTAVFADLNKGENITSGLKKVDKSQMTHKNPELRKKPVEIPTSKKPVPPKKPASLTSIKKKPAKTELVDGTKWIIENYVDVAKPIEIEVEMAQSVFIGNCSGATIILKGKANAISISETKKCGVIVDSLVSGVELIKSQKFGLQINGTVQMINVDKCDEGSIYLSKESADICDIFSSSTMSLNIVIPKGDDDSTELAVPEQFKHSIVDGKLVSEVVKHAG